MGVATNISWDDYSRMGVSNRKLFKGRKLPTPSWAVNDSELQSLVARFFEERAWLRSRPKAGSPSKRLALAQKMIVARGPRWIGVLDKLCREYTELKRTNTDPDRQRTLEIQIENVDTRLVFAEKGPAVVVAMVYMYYRRGLTSPEIAVELGCKPPLVRRTLHKLDRLWKEMSKNQKP